MRNVFYVSIVAAAYTVFSVGSAEAQYYGTQKEAKFFDWEFNFNKMVMEVRSEQEDRSSVSGDYNNSRELFLIAPMVGATVSGSVYHPNLLMFEIEVLEGMSFEEEKTDGIEIEETQGGSGDSSIGDIRISAMLLNEKPYGGRYTYSRSDSIREYDYFSRVRVEGSRHILTSRCNLWEVPVRVSYNKWQEDVRDLSRPTTRREDDFRVNAEHMVRDKSATRFLYSLEDYNYEDAGIEPQIGTRVTAQFSNDYQSDSQRKITLSSSADIYKLESNYSEYDRLAARELLNVKHSDRFSTSYSLGFNQNDSDGQETTGFDGGFSANHKLYESLNSSFNINWDNSETSGDESSWANERIGWGVGENYGKKLGEWGVLNLQARHQMNDTVRDVEGRLIPIIDESHRLRDGEQVLLQYTKVVESTVRVTDKSGKILYVKNLDYRLVNRGLFMEIQRLFAGTIVDGSEVLIDYSAESDGSEEYSTVTRTYGANLSIDDGLVNVYVNAHTMDNDGSTSSTVYDLDTLVMGASIATKGVQLGVEHRDEDSSSIPYTSLRFYQNYFIDIGDRSVLRVDMIQRRADYSDFGQQEVVSTRSISYDVRMTRTISLSLSGGLYDEKGRGIDREFETFRGSLDWRLGRSSLLLDWYVTNEKDVDRLDERNAFTMRFERVF